MQRIRILNTCAGHDWHFDPGAIVRIGTRFRTNAECPADFAETLVRGGTYAEALPDEAAPIPTPAISTDEVATLPPVPETAVVRKGRRGRG